MDEREHNMGENNSGDGQRMPGEPDFSNRGQKPVRGGGEPLGGVRRDHMRWDALQGQTQEPATQVGPAVQPQQPAPPAQQATPPSSQPFPQQQSPQQPEPPQGLTPPPGPGQEPFTDPYQSQLSSQPQEK